MKDKLDVCEAQDVCEVCGNVIRMRVSIYQAGNACWGCTKASWALVDEKETPGDRFGNRKGTCRVCMKDMCTKDGLAYSDETVEYDGKTFRAIVHEKCKNGKFVNKKGQ